MCFCVSGRREIASYHDENYLFEEAPLAEVEAVYSASEESDGQAYDHEPTNMEYSSSSADSDELEDTNRRDGFIIDDYDDFQEKICFLFVYFVHFYLKVRLLARVVTDEGSD
jgi:hypothetical protein